MGREIERKYLVCGEKWKDSEPVYYCQGYLSRRPDATVRVRIAGLEAWLTVKSPVSGISRDEWEYRIPREDAEEMINLCPDPPVRKFRREIEFDGFIWEVDEFLGDNSGLVLAEIELEFEGQEFSLPAWIDREVTGDPRYFNSNLSVNPFVMWKKG